MEDHEEESLHFLLSKLGKELREKREEGKPRDFRKEMQIRNKLVEEALRHVKIRDDFPYIEDIEFLTSLYFQDVEDNPALAALLSPSVYKAFMKELTLEEMLHDLKHPFEMRDKCLIEGLRQDQEAAAKASESELPNTHRAGVAMGQIRAQQERGRKLGKGNKGTQRSALRDLVKYAVDEIDSTSFKDVWAHFQRLSQDTHLDEDLTFYELTEKKITFEFRGKLFDRSASRVKTILTELKKSR